MSISHTKALFDKRNSLLYWFPKLPSGIPTPKTGWVVFPNELGRELMDRSKESFEKFQPYLKKIKELAKSMGYPVFIRTDMASAKHAWKKGAFVRHQEELLQHILETLEFNEMAGMLGLNYKAIVVREFLELDWRFKAFHGEMPVAKERRYFVKGKVICHHPYWIKEAIVDAHKHEGSKKDFFGYIPHKLPNTWEHMLQEINYEYPKELTLLKEYALKVAKVFPDYWSVDFACSRNGKWYLIDMANGYASYHPKPCRHLLSLDYK